MYSTMVAVLITSTCFAHDPYYEAMKTNIAAVYNAPDIGALQRAVNVFEKIGAAEPAKWEPQYYAAFGYVMMATRETDMKKKDAYLDGAMRAVEKAKAVVPAESEIMALEAFIYMMRITVDPASRGAELAPVAMQAFRKATALNPENPRALALMARMQYGSAQFFGASTAEACALVEKALTKFENYEPENPLAPTWGKPMAESLKQQCQ